MSEVGGLFRRLLSRWGVPLRERLLPPGIRAFLFGPPPAALEVPDGLSPLAEGLAELSRQSEERLMRTLGGLAGTGPLRAAGLEICAEGRPIALGPAAPSRTPLRRLWLFQRPAPDLRATGR